MSNMKDWAKKEIEIACNKEKEDCTNDEFNYGVACYNSAFKAFESLCNDGHSGLSISITKNILNRLINGQVLTPIEDTDDVWSEAKFYNRPYKTYQCTRMSSFFKDVYEDGRVSYHDNDRFICFDINSNSTYYNGFINRLASEYFPIEMPYMPSNDPYRVACTEYLTDRKNGDYDTLGIIYILTPNCEKHEINRYFKDNVNGRGFIEISEDEYLERIKMHNERESMEANNK